MKILVSEAFFYFEEKDLRIIVVPFEKNVEKKRMENFSDREPQIQRKDIPLPYKYC